MSTIPISYRNWVEVHGVLLSCDEFESNARVRDALVGELLPFRDRVEEASTRQGRVDKLINYLHERQLPGNRNVLVVFLRMLAKSYEREDERSTALEHAALMLEGGGVRAGKVEIPCVVVAMNDGEAHDLIRGGPPQAYHWSIQPSDQEAVAAFRGELRIVGVDLDELVRNYAATRDAWCPFGPGGGRIDNILAQMEADLNDPNKLPSGKQLPRIRLQSYSEEFFAADFVMRQDVRRRLLDTKCVFVADAVSLFHPDLRNKLLRSELGSTSPVLILSPVNAELIAPNQRIMSEIMQREMQWAFSRFIDEPTQLCEFRSGSPAMLKRWLVIALCEQALALSEQPDRAAVAELQRQSELHGRIGIKLFGSGG